MPTIRLEFRGALAAMVRCGRHGPSGPSVVRTVPEIPSVKDAIEAVGVPHVEVGRVESATGRPLSLADPIPETTATVVHPVAPYRLEPPRLICDQHLGKLVRLLRIMGFDSSWGRDWREPEIARRAVNEDRAVVSGSRSLLVRKTVTRGLLVLVPGVDAQAAAVLRRFRLADRVEFFGRCGLCNGRLREVAKADVASRIPPRTAAWLDEYFLCTGCDQLYWEGTHVATLRRRIAAIQVRARSRSSGES